ncbi:hypothetical protein ILYODFUR_017526 [Ilyodon furcidens]|uniref:Uncharacterized protein n=1 Tax=Ilyodon furcidens TaxID=33524 RepID=A0ABV0SPG0_9TELE
MQNIFKPFCTILSDVFKAYKEENYIKNGKYFIPHGPNEPTNQSHPRMQQSHPPINSSFNPVNLPHPMNSNLYFPTGHKYRTHASEPKWQESPLYRGHTPTRALQPPVGL